MQKILVLGAGMVAKPLVEYLLDAGYRITVASNTPDNATRMIAGKPGGKSLYWEADDEFALVSMIRESDLVISLLPYRFHTLVAKACIAEKKNMVTTSYVKEEMKALNTRAMEAGIILLNEIGLDPGIDHMSAMRIIDKIHANNGKVEAFYSICGALPAPESADNPFKYKFSWSPKGVILASKNNAEYLKNGKIIHIESENLFKHRFTHNIPGLGELEVYPNRDSISYIDIYGIPEARTMLRGTFRYRGWCEILDSMRELRLLSEVPADYSGYSFRDFLGSRLPEGDTGLKQRLAAFLNSRADSMAVKAYEWLGLLSDKDMGYKTISPFEIIYNLMLAKMMIGDDDRDMIVLKHLFLASYPGGRREVITSQMIDFGSPATNTSIARTVGLPAAIAADMILKGEINISGVYIPVKPEIYNPVLNRLEQIGISMQESFGLPESEFIN
ncbi:MAG: saccharopine dehydrogenase C-terminal domain-containing protein [Marinilabiliaceae bacterium]|jgi:saccharopine dehydrogenase-like NADP-dependent oxidoreductase|nr:saccharopine dehydrogenase C-terminal domain-containing protein [Marinilabiliaceae bacterium]